MGPRLDDEGFRIITDGCYMTESEANQWREDSQCRLRYSSCVSEDCRDLLRQMFSPEVDRITMDEILEHPFIQSALENDVDFFQITLNCKLPLAPNPKFDPIDCPEWFTN